MDNLRVMVQGWIVEPTQAKVDSPYQKGSQESQNTRDYKRKEKKLRKKPQNHTQKPQLN